MSLPFAIVLATGMICATVLIVVAASFAWAARHRGSDKNKKAS
jgi:hypothetical protein